MKSCRLGVGMAHMRNLEEVHRAGWSWVSRTEGWEKVVRAERGGVQDGF